MISEKNPGDFSWAVSYDPDFIGKLMYNGFLTMCERVDLHHCILLPKLHVVRCVVDLNCLKISKSALKKSRGFKLSINKDFDGVCDAIVEQHGENWFQKPLVAAFKEMNRRGSSGSNGGRVFVHSFELWKVDGEELSLAAGEVGYSFGGCYTSLSGFSKVDSSGTIQLAATGCFLKSQGYQMWDFGMEIEYKIQLGATNLPRNEFIRELEKTRDILNTRFLELEPTDARTIIASCKVAPIVNADPMSKSQMKKKRKASERAQRKQQNQSPDPPAKEVSVKIPAKEIHTHADTETGVAANQGERR